MPDSHSQRNPVELLAEEFLQRYRRGERPALSEYTARYPDNADEIRELFPLLVQMEGAGPDTEGDELPHAEAADADQPQPTQIGDYLIVRELGRGGMGVVYEAQQQSLGRRVALKVLPLHASKDDTALKRFRREARAAAKLHHTNIVPVFDVGAHGDTCFYAMQFIQGQPLDVVIAELRRQRHTPDRPDEVQTEAIDPDAANCARSLLRGGFAKRNFAETPAADSTGPLDPHELPSSVPRTHESVVFARPGGAVSPPVANDRYYIRSVAQIGRQVADALAYAHSRGVIHRDVKPSNLILDAAGVIWITDFGMAKVDDDALTHTGDILGTLRYMAPERFGGECDARADIYALGLTLYELLVLKPAFDSSDRLRLVEMISRQALRRPRALDPRIPRDLETIVLRATEKDPRRRYQTAEQLADDLQRFVENRPIQARRIGGAERFVRWWQRNPVAASLSVVMGVLMISVAVVSTLVAFRMRERAAVERDLRVRALGAEKIARANAQRSADQAEVLRREDYVRRVKLADRERLDNDLVRANELLLGCPEDLRGWEWDYVRRRCRLALQSFSESAQSVNSVAFSPDGNRIAVGTGTFLSRRYSAGDLVVRDVTSGEIVFAHRGLRGTFSAVAFSPDGSRIASGNGPDLTVWNAATGEQLFQIQDDPLEVLCVAFSPDGRRLLAGFGRFNGDAVGYAKLVDANSGKLLREPIPAHTAGVWAVAFHGDGKRAALTSEGLIDLWDLEQGRLLETLRGHDGFIYTVAFSHDGRYLATGGLDQTIRLWDLDSAGMLRTFSGHRGIVRHLDFSRDGRHFVSASEDKSLKLWDMHSERELATFQGHAHFVNCVAFSPDGKLFASGSLDQSVKTWFAAPDHQLTYAGHRPKGHVHGLAFSPTGRAVASGSLYFAASTDRLHLWDPTTGEQLVQFPQNIGALAALAFNRDGSRIAAGQENGDVTLWQADTGRLVQRLQNHIGTAAAVAFSPDATRLASAGQDAGINVWNTADGRLVHTFVGHSDFVRTVAFSPDGRILASAGDDGIVKLWDLENGTIVRALEGHVGKVRDVTFSPQGKWIASAGGVDHRQGDLRLWDRESGRLVHQLAGHTDIVSDVAFSPDGSRLVSGSDDRTVKLWDPDWGREVFTLRGHSGGVVSVAFSPDGRRIVSGSVDRTVKVWDLDPADADVLYRREAVALLEAGRASLDRFEWEQARGAFARAGALGIDHAELSCLRGQANLRLGRDAEAEVDFARALELAPDDPATLCDLGLRFASLGRESLAVAALDRAQSLAPQDREVVLAHARVEAQLGRQDESDKIFRRAAATLDQQTSHGPERPVPWLSTGWWVAGPYAQDSDAHRLPQSTVDLFRPDRSAASRQGDGHETQWRTGRREGDGYLDLSAAFDGAQRADGYALQHVYATNDRPVALLVGSDDTLELWLDGEPIYQSRTSRNAEPAEDAVPATLRRGWNTLLAKVGGRAGRHGLYLEISDRPPDLARAYYETGALDRAIEVWRSASVTEHDDPSLLWLTGNALARRGLWNEAAEVFQSLTRRQPARNRNWIVLAPLLVYTGRHDAYQQLCRQLNDHFGQSGEPVMAERTAKASLLLPAYRAADDPAVRLAEHAVSVGSEHRFFKYFQLAAGIARYRSGDFEGAAEATAHSRRTNAGADPYLEALDGLIEAMALVRLGRKQDAQPLYVNASRIISDQLPQHEQPDLGAAWPDWLICHIALREAEAVFSAQSQSAEAGRTDDESNAAN